MRNAARNKRVKHAGGLLMDALTGRLGMAMMTVSYIALAALLLFYVCTQVYAGSVMEDIAALEEDSRTLEDEIGGLMTSYNALMSRKRVSDYCVTNLRMVEANGSDVTRVRLQSSGDEGGRRRDESSERQVFLPRVMGSDVAGLTEVNQR